MDFMFFLTAAALGVGLAMDAFSVSLANGLQEPDMRPPRAALIAGTFAGFQIAMPMIGWFCVHTVAHYFRKFEPFIPYIALFLLLFIGGKMIVEAYLDKKKKAAADGEEAETEEAPRRLGLAALLVQGVATSIDALSVGFTIAEYGTLEALAASLTIGVLTFAICTAGVWIGRKFGVKLAGKATVLGGIILIAIGVEIFVSNVFF